MPLSLPPPTPGPGSEGSGRNLNARGESSACPGRGAQQHRSTSRRQGNEVGKHPFINANGWCERWWWIRRWWQSAASASCHAGPEPSLDRRFISPRSAAAPGRTGAVPVKQQVGDPHWQVPPRVRLFREARAGEQCEQLHRLGELAPPPPRLGPRVAPVLVFEREHGAAHEMDELDRPVWWRGSRELATGSKSESVKTEPLRA